MTAGSAKAILETVAKAYSTFAEYHDAGFVRSERMKVPFETHFIRGRFFDFAFSGNPTGGEMMPVARVTWRPGELAFWTILKGAPQPETLRMAVAALTGISSGAAHGAPSLLLDEVGGWLPTDLREPMLLPGREIAGVPCREVRGKHPNTSAEELLFVEEASSLIRARVAHRGYEHYTEYTTCRAQSIAA
jgi:hypothetical protein